ncbi:MAG: hypothetical protein B7Z37_09955 [Verrucomicrobia bacterium 12-59-8]|nr:MAG: hypothetical protein B7Z37_09955 [Verrucomicrobia bacterium 12-59-8]
MTGGFRQQFCMPVGFSLIGIRENTKRACIVGMLWRAIIVQCCNPENAGATAMGIAHIGQHVAQHAACLGKTCASAAHTDHVVKSRAADALGAGDVKEGISLALSHDVDEGHGAR